MKLNKLEIDEYRRVRSGLIENAEAIGKFLMKLWECEGRALNIELSEDLNEIRMASTYDYEVYKSFDVTLEELINKPALMERFVKEREAFIEEERQKVLKEKHAEGLRERYQLAKLKKKYGEK